MFRLQWPNHIIIKSKQCYLITHITFKTEFWINFWLFNQHHGLNPFAAFITICPCQTIRHYSPLWKLKIWILCRYFVIFTMNIQSFGKCFRKCDLHTQNRFDLSFMISFWDLNFFLYFVTIASQQLHTVCWIGCVFIQLRISTFTLLTSDDNGIGPFECTLHVWLNRNGKYFWIE